MNKIWGTNEGNVTNSVNEMERRMTGRKCCWHVETAKQATPEGIKALETTGLWWHSEKSTWMHRIGYVSIEQEKVETEKKCWFWSWHVCCRQRRRIFRGFICWEATNFFAPFVKYYKTSLKVRVKWSWRFTLFDYLYEFTLFVFIRIRNFCYEQAFSYNNLPTNKLIGRWIYK